MKLYLDTSALVKLYIEEPDHQHVQQAVIEADTIVTSVVAYAEARSAFARRLREHSITSEAHERIVATMNRDWIEFDRVVVSDDLAYTAGHIAASHALRGYDAIHLATAVALHRSSDNLRFLAFDARLVEAARHLVAIFEI